MNNEGDYIMAIQPVKIYGPDGKLKEEITSEQASMRFWSRFEDGFNPRPAISTRTCQVCGDNFRTTKQGDICNVCREK